MSSELKKLKNNFKKKFNLTEEQVNKLRWHKVTTDPKYKDILPAFNELRIKFVCYLLKRKSHYTRFWDLTLLAI